MVNQVQMKVAEAFLGYWYGLRSRGELRREFCPGAMLAVLTPPAHIRFLASPNRWRHHQSLD
jgi:hypothetical protein